MSSYVFSSLAAGARDSTTCSGRYVYVESATGDVELTIVDKDGNHDKGIYPARGFIEVPGMLQRIEVRNPGGSSIDVTLRTGWVRYIPPGNVSGSSVTVEPGTDPIVVDGPLTDAELRATPVPVDGPLTDAELRATPVPVDGPLTDAELRATPVPVDGPLTDAELRASAVPVDLQAGTSGGINNYHHTTDATTNATVVKNSAGKLYGVIARNAAASMRKIAFHDTASTPTAGTGVDLTLAVGNNASGFWYFPQGIQFSSGIAFTVVTGALDADATAPAANDVVFDVLWK